MKEKNISTGIARAQEKKTVKSYFLKIMPTLTFFSEASNACHMG